MLSLNSNKNIFRKCLLSLSIFFLLLGNLLIRSEGMETVLYLYLLALLVIFTYYLYWAHSLHFVFKDDSITVYKDKQIIFKGLEHEIMTDEKNWVYIFPNNIIIFGSILSCINDKDVLHKFFNSKFNFSIVSTKELFFKMMKTSIVFRFLIITILLAVAINLVIALFLVSTL